MIEDKVLEKEDQSNTAILLISKSRPTIFLASNKADL